MVDFQLFTVVCNFDTGIFYKPVKIQIYNQKNFCIIFIPFYSLTHIFKNFPLCRKIRKIARKNIVDTINEKLTLDVVVTDGKKNNIPCKLELTSENGLAKS